MRGLSRWHIFMLLQGMDLEFKTKDSAAKPQVVRVAFDPPLTGYEEVKPRLLGMKADADEALGTVCDPFAPRPRSIHPHGTRSPHFAVPMLAHTRPIAATSLPRTVSPTTHTLIYVCNNRSKPHKSRTSNYRSRSGPPARFSFF
jgi:hypothetical protein